MIKHGVTKVKIQTDKDPVVVDVTVPLKLQVHSIPSLTNYAMDMQKQKLLKESIQDEMQRATKQLVKKSQKDFKGEPFIWGI